MIGRRRTRRAFRRPGRSSEGVHQTIVTRSRVGLRLIRAWATRETHRCVHRVRERSWGTRLAARIEGIHAVSFDTKTAVVGSRQRSTHLAGSARLRRTRVDLCLAADSGVSRGARAAVRRNAVDTCGAVDTGCRRTFRNVRLAQCSRKPLRAQTCERVDAIRARCPVLAWKGRAFLDVREALRSLVSGSTCAQKRGRSVVACTAVAARSRRALINVRLAAIAREPRPAEA